MEDILFWMRVISAICFAITGAGLIWILASKIWWWISDMIEDRRWAAHLRRSEEMKAKYPKPARDWFKS